MTPVLGELRCKNFQILKNYLSKLKKRPNCVQIDLSDVVEIVLLVEIQ